MLTLLVACSLSTLVAVSSSEENHPNTALLWQPFMWFAVYLSATLLLLMVMVTCVTRRERADIKGLLGADLVERSVLEGEQAGGPCEWLSRRWPWSPVPQRSPQLSQLRMGLARSTQPLLCYQLIEKRHVHLTRGALCVVRMDLQELQELAEQENMTKTPRGSRDSDDPSRSYDSRRGSERLGSVTSNSIVQLGTVESSSQPLFRTVEPLESGAQRVTWSQPTEDFASGAEFLGEGGVGEPLPEDIPTDSVVITGGNTQSCNEIRENNFAPDVKHMVKWGTVGETTRHGKTAYAGGNDDSQSFITVAEEITQVSDDVTHFKNVAKARSYFDIHREESKKHEPIISLEDTPAKRDLLSYQDEQVATDIDQTSESDILDEISGSSDDFPTYLPSYKQSQEHDFSFVNNTELDREFKTFTSISSPNCNPEASPLQKEEPPAIDNTITQSPSVYMSVLDKDTQQLPKHTLPTEEMDESDVGASVSSCFLHPVAPPSQQEWSQSNKHNNSKTVQYVSIHPEKENSAQNLQYCQQAEYQVAPASVITTNNTAFSAGKTPTKCHSAKSSEKSIVAEEEPGLPTSWDLLYSFPCHTETVQMPIMDTTSQINTVSDSYSGLKQHDEHYLYQRWKGDDVPATKQQESRNVEHTTDSRHTSSRADEHTSKELHPTSSFRPEYIPGSCSKTTTEQQHCPLTTTASAGEHHKVLKWRITISPHPVSSSK